MRLLSHLANGDVGFFPWRTFAQVSRSFSLSENPILVRGRLFTSDLVYSSAYPTRCELATARPSMGATVVISTPTGRRVGRTMTDERGIFRMRLKPGSYVVTAPDLAISRKIEVTRQDNPSFDLVSVG